MLPSCDLFFKEGALTLFGLIQIKGGTTTFARQFRLFSLTRKATERTTQGLKKQGGIEHDKSKTTDGACRKCRL